VFVVFLQGEPAGITNGRELSCSFTGYDGSLWLSLVWFSCPRVDPFGWSPLMSVRRASHQPTSLLAGVPPPVTHQ
jgi:hypothetical protein